MLKFSDFKAFYLLCKSALYSDYEQFIYRTFSAFSLYSFQSVFVVKYEIESRYQGTMLETFLEI